MCVQNGLSAGLVAVALIGCGAHSFESKSVDEKPRVGPGISGTVTLDGEPVRAFGIALTPTSPVTSVEANMDHLLVSNYSSVNSRRGRFEINSSSGLWDLHIFGEGFAKHIVRGVAVGDERVSLSDIRVDRGFAIGGIARANGTPIGGASVSIVQTHRVTEDKLLARSWGNFFGTSDTTGVFRVDGIYPASKRARISAVVPQMLASYAMPIRTDMDSMIVLEMFPAGHIAGDIATSQPEDVIIVITPTAQPVSTLAVGANSEGQFRFDNVPEGQYDLGVLLTSGSSGTRFVQRVSVGAGQTVTPHLQIP